MHQLIDAHHGCLQDAYPQVEGKASKILRRGVPAEPLGHLHAREVWVLADNFQDLELSLRLMADEPLGALYVVIQKLAMGVEKQGWSHTADLVEVFDVEVQSVLWDEGGLQGGRDVEEQMIAAEQHIARFLVQTHMAWRVSSQAHGLQHAAGTFEHAAVGYCLD